MISTKGNNMLDIILRLRYNKVEVMQYAKRQRA